MAYPSSYETKANYFDDLGDLVVLDIDSASLVSGSTYQFNVNAADTSLLSKVKVGHLLTYTYTAAAGAVEVVKVTAIGGTYVQATRAQDGTTALSPAWNTGAVLILEPTAGLYEMMRSLVLTTEKYTGLTNTIADPNVTQPGGALPNSGEFYFNTSTGDIWVCFVANTWVKINKYDHSTYTGLTAEQAHSIYLTDKAQPGNTILLTFQDWHTNIPGDHVTGGATHAHDGTNGAPVAKVATVLQSWVNQVLPQHTGDMVYAYDTKALYFAKSDLTGWEPYSSLPQGSIAMFDGTVYTTCPTGWVRVTDMDDRLPKGTAGTYTGLTTGGSSSHQHTLATLINHTHTVPAATVTVVTGGSHQHVVRSYGSSGGGAPVTNQTASNLTKKNSSNDGDHTHSVAFDAASTGASGVTTTIKTNAVPNNSYPLYYKIIFCRKS